jgi:predicted nucleotidyltransferase
MGLYGLMDVQDTATRVLGRPADIMTRRSLHHLLRAEIEATAVPVF